MHEETKRSLIDEGTTVLGTLIKEMVIHRAEMDTLEQRHEHELELERTRQQHQGGGELEGGSEGAEHQEAMHVESEVVDTGGRAGVGGHPDFDRVLDRLEAEDQCSLCRDLLRAIREQPPDVQAEALAEYGKLKGAMEAGATQDDLERLIDNSDVLLELLENKLSDSRP